MSESRSGVSRWTSLALASAVLGSSIVGCGGGSDSAVVATPPPAVANVPPEALFVVRSAGLAATFDASSSKDSDGSIAKYAWNFGEPSSGETNIAEAVSVSHTYSTAGTYTVTLTITDNAGATSVKTSQVTVAPVNVAPVAAFAVTTSGLVATVDAASSTDPDGSIVSYAWSFSDGTTLVPQSTRQTNHTFAAAGSYTATLVVTDNLGAQATVTQPVVVAVPNQAPASAFVATSNNLIVSVDGAASSDADGTIAEYTWNFGDPSSGVANIATGRLASKTYSAAGTYTISLTVKDDAGATTTSTQSVTVTAANVAPVAAFSSSVNGPTVTFVGSGSNDPDGTIVSYAWNFGETSSSSNTSSVVNPSHVYSAIGTYNVSLTVTDNRGATNTTTQPVTITSTTVLGSGNLQFTASWSRPGDADLFITTPTGKMIDFRDRGPNANTDFGALDADDQVGTGPENIFWAPQYTPPSGTYYVCMYTGGLSPSSANPLTVTLNIRVPNAPVVTTSRTFTTVLNDFTPCTASSPSLLRSFVYP